MFWIITITKQINIWFAQYTPWDEFCKLLSKEGIKRSGKIGNRHYLCQQFFQHEFWRIKCYHKNCFSFFFSFFYFFFCVRPFGWASFMFFSIAARSEIADRSGNPVQSANNPLATPNLVLVISWYDSTTSAHISCRIASGLRCLVLVARLLARRPCGGGIVGAGPAAAANTLAAAAARCPKRLPRR